MRDRRMETKRGSGKSADTEGKVSRNDDGIRSSR